MHPMLTIAVKAARRAGGIINRAAQNLDLLHVSRKAHSDFVSEVDGAAEDAIIRTLLEAYPSHSILAEESGAQGDPVKSEDRKSTRLNSSHMSISYAVFCLKK